MEQKCANCGNGKWRDGITAITDNCIECKYVDKDGKLQPSNWKPKVSSNADIIRAMNDEELAEWMARTQIKAMKELMNLLRIPYDEPDGLVETGKTEVLQWLKRPAE